MVQIKKYKIAAQKCKTIFARNKVHELFIHIFFRFPWIAQKRFLENPQHGPTFALLLARHFLDKFSAKIRSSLLGISLSRKLQVRRRGRMCVCSLWWFECRSTLHEWMAKRVAKRLYKSTHVAGEFWTIIAGLSRCTWLLDLSENVRENVKR